MKLSRISCLTILFTILALYICGSGFAAGPKVNANNAKGKPAVKLPVFKNVKFTDDDQKFYVWLNEFYPVNAGTLRSHQKDAKVFKERFYDSKSRWRRLWKGYKENKKLGLALIVEVRLRNERNELLVKFKARIVKSTTDKEYKDRIRGELTKVVAKEFDNAMAIKRIKYEGLTKRIPRMTNYLASSEKKIHQLVEHKDAEVKKRVESLLKDGKVDPNRKHPKNKGVASKKNAGIKLPVINEHKFNDDDQKFYVYLYEFFPNQAQDLKDLEKNPKEFINEFSSNKHMFSRLWMGYKHNHQYGKTLVEEVKLRVKRLDILEALQSAKNEKQKVKLRNDLNKIVPKEFDVAVKVKKLRYEGLKKKIKRMEKELARRENEVKKLVKDKGQQVKKRVDDLIKGEEKINWK